MKFSEIKINKQLLPLKTSYFFLFACLGPIIGFLPTIAKQLGYSLTTYGATMTVISMVTTLWTPITGIIVDKFHVKKIFFLMAVSGMGVVSILFMFVPKAPLDSVVELKCDNETTFNVNNIENELNNRNNETFFIRNSSYNNELITCKLNCRNNMDVYDKEINEFKNQSDFCDNWIPSTDDSKYLYKHNDIDITLQLNDTERIKNSYVFHLLSVQINGTQVPSTSCQCYLKTSCHIKCSNEVITDVATASMYRGNVLKLFQFWSFFLIIILFSICSITSNAILSTICLDTLGEKSEDFGKQKCFASIGWGTFSIFIGWLVDVFSINKKEKNYSPVYYSCLIMTICNLASMTKIKVIETKKSTGKWKNVRGLFSKYYIISFYIWSALTTFLHTIITHFLFWYMEDLVSENNNNSQRARIKTLQGLAQGIQCFGGEIPFFFWSGMIIKRMGHINCMALVLGAMAIRMYLYTVISNPAWIILIELLNGVSYALGYSVKMSYAKAMSPPDTTNAILGIVGFFDCIGESLGSLLGGYLFDSYGGLWSFRFFAYCSAFMCCLNIVTNYFGIMKELKTTNTIVTPSTKSVHNETNINK